MATDEEILASVRSGKPPANCPVLGTWQLRSYVRERLSDGQRHNQFGEAPVGYIGYAPDGRMYAIFTRDVRVAPRDVVPTDEASSLKRLSDLANVAVKNVPLGIACRKDVFQTRQSCLKYSRCRSANGAQRHTQRLASGSSVPDRSTGAPSTNSEVQVRCEARTDREQHRSSALDDLRELRRQDETRRT